MYSSSFFFLLLLSLSLYLPSLQSFLSFQSPSSKRRCSFSSQPLHPNRAAQVYLSTGWHSGPTFNMLVLVLLFFFSPLVAIYFRSFTWPYHYTTLVIENLRSRYHLECFGKYYDQHEFLIFWYFSRRYDLNQIFELQRVLQSIHSKIKPRRFTC